jgi:hypothetical protein
MRRPLARFPLIPELPYLDPGARAALLKRHRAAVEEEWFLVHVLSMFALPTAAVAASAWAAYRFPGGFAGVSTGFIAFFIVWSTLLLIRAVTLAAMMRPRVLAELRTRGLCTQCGYDLRGTPGRCPECGTATPGRTAGV